MLRGQRPRLQGGWAEVSEALRTGGWAQRPSAGSKHLHGHVEREQAAAMARLRGET